MDQVLLVLQQEGGQQQRIEVFALADEGQRGQYRDPAFPEAVAADQGIEERPGVIWLFDFLEGFAAFVEVLADDIGSR